MILCPQLTPVIKEYENEWFTVNNRAGYFTFEPNSAQVAVLVKMAEQIVLVQVKRPVINDHTWELPAGGCQNGETPEQAAVREVYEETGIAVLSHRLIPLDSLSICPNRYVSNPFIFFVEIDEHEWLNRACHDDEISDVSIFYMNQIQAMLLANEIYVALPALILAKLLLAPNYDVSYLTLKGNN